jgi:hypothetical protein
MSQCRYRYVSIGIECNDERLEAKKSDRHTHSSCDVAFYNVVRCIT